MPAVVVEIELPKCSLVWSEDPCTASGDDGTECYNTRFTCQDVDNFTPDDYIVKFSSHALDDYIPFIKSENLIPARCELGKLPRFPIWDFVIDDRVASDTTTDDPYLDNRIVASGGYVSRLRERYKYFRGRKATVRWNYDSSSDSFDNSQELVVDTFKANSNGTFSLRLTHPLTDLFSNSLGLADGFVLLEDITDSATSMLASNIDMTVGQRLQLGDEIIRISAIGSRQNGGRNYTIARAQLESSAIEHDASSEGTGIYWIDNQTPGEALYDALEEAGMSTDDIEDFADFDGEFTGVSLNGGYVGSVGCNTVVKDILELTGSMIGLKDDGSIQFFGGQQFDNTAIELVEGGISDEDQVRIVDLSREFATRVQVKANRKALGDVYFSQYRAVDNDLESSDQLNDQVERIIETPLLDLNGNVEAGLFARRHLDLRNNPDLFRLEFAYHNAQNLAQGDIVKVPLRELTDANGQTRLISGIVISVQPIFNKALNKVVVDTWENVSSLGIELVTLAADATSLNLATVCSTSDNYQCTIVTIPDGIEIEGSASDKDAMNTGSLVREIMRLDIYGDAEGGGGAGGGEGSINGKRGGYVCRRNAGVQVVEIAVKSTGVAKAGGGGGGMGWRKENHTYPEGGDNVEYTVNFRTGGGGGQGKPGGTGGQVTNADISTDPDPDPPNLANYDGSNGSETSFGGGNGAAGNGGLFGASGQTGGYFFNATGTVGSGGSSTVGNSKVYVIEATGTVET